MAYGYHESSGREIEVWGYVSEYEEYSNIFIKGLYSYSRGNEEQSIELEGSRAYPNSKIKFTLYGFKVPEG